MARLRRSPDERQRIAPLRELRRVPRLRVPEARSAKAEAFNRGRIPAFPGSLSWVLPSKNLRLPPPDAGTVQFDLRRNPRYFRAQKRPTASQGWTSGISTRAVVGWAGGTAFIIQLSRSVAPFYNTLDLSGPASVFLLGTEALGLVISAGLNGHRLFRRPRNERSRCKNRGPLGGESRRKAMQDVELDGFVVSWRGSA